MAATVCFGATCGGVFLKLVSNEGRLHRKPTSQWCVLGTLVTAELIGIYTSHDMAQVKVLRGLKFRISYVQRSTDQCRNMSFELLMNRVS